ncbi:pseudouridine synthase [Tothia fuscella]|uniref:tRNA pseudouridine synthase 1 n=1 Tax=Tothia fuscella TaxID=1048955 RepID=A0A9P4TYU1_9PEZI|nr:pseudouridine synthase [Tothia fuscella]
MVEANTNPEAPKAAPPSQSSNPDSRQHDRGQKRKKDFGRGDRGRPRKDLGRSGYFKSNPDRRQRNEDSQSKRQKQDDEPDSKNNLPAPFSQAEITAEDRRPKRKVAVLLGYSGSGYKGMQIMPDQRTIEGDLFAAFIAAGAISKANANDPKKSSFVRCARTDKGVHAAGNVISLKLIIEEPDIVEKINEHLSPQIRVFGFERTTGSFSCYQACDSRWYEYLIPTHCFLPPHPSSFLGQKLVEVAMEAEDLEGYKSRQEEVADFWEKVDATHIKPILEALDDESRQIVEQALYHTRTTSQEFEDAEEDADAGSENGDTVAPVSETVETTAPADEQTLASNPPREEEESIPADTIPNKPELEAAIKSLKSAYLKAKETYRISPTRLDRVRKAFAQYEGTNNFHNYTIRKSPNDPSAKRHIISFKVAEEPTIIDNTEWLSLKVHGQSFMMHQIRKMVGLAALVVRCGTPMERLAQTLSMDLYSIPKAPGLGLLLERPVFTSYNEKTAKQFEKEDIDFGKYEKEVEVFKRREIYARIFREEERDRIFHSFFTHLDNYKEPIFLYVTSKGIEACGPSPRTASNVHLPSRRERKGFKGKYYDREDGNAKAGAEAGSA